MADADRLAAIWAYALDLESCARHLRWCLDSPGFGSLKRVTSKVSLLVSISMPCFWNVSIFLARNPWCGYKPDAKFEVAKARTVVGGQKYADEVRVAVGVFNEPCAGTLADKRLQSHEFQPVAKVCLI